MRIQITARHCELPSSIQARAEELMQKLQRVEPRLARAEIVFEEERHLKLAEGILSVDGEEPTVARGEGADFRAALDQMNERLRRILRRRRERVRTHQGPSASEVAAPEA